MEQSTHNQHPSRAPEEEQKQPAPQHVDMQVDRNTPIQTIEHEEPHAKKSLISKLLGNWGAIGALLFFVLGKSKYLLIIFKVAKFHTLISMMVVMWVYAQIWGVKFAVGFVLLIFIHECGHALTMRKLGIPAGAPVFIPFVGAVIAMKEMPKDAYTEALVGLGGPALGTVGAIFCLMIGFLGGGQFWFALAYTGFMLNLFNMIPISPLDGGRIVGVLSRWLWLIGFAVGGYLFYRIGSPILLLVLILGVFSFFSSFKEQDPSYYQVSLERRILIGIGYFGSLCIMALGLWIAQMPLQGIG